MRLRMYNVEFGDAFLLCGQRENLLVDLGSIDPAVDFAPIQRDIARESLEKEASLLLTHFHEDHWSGLRRQPGGPFLPPFRVVYLPNLFGIRTPGKLDPVVSGLLGELLEAVVLDRALHFTLADLLREVLPSLDWGKVRFLQQGDMFSADGVNYRVLWPKRESMARRMTGQLREFLKQLDALLLERGMERPLLEFLGDLADLLLRDLAAYTGYQQQLDLWPYNGSSYEELYGQAQRASDILRESFRTLNRESRVWHQFRHYADALKEDWNKLSIVFHNAESCEENLLMTGDVPSGVLDQIALGKMKGVGFWRHYFAVKAPHHGTKSHFCPRLPDCRYICISNGRGNRRYQRITDWYEKTYGVGSRRAVLQCTNGRCEYLARSSCPGCTALPPQACHTIP